MRLHSHTSPNVTKRNRSKPASDGRERDFVVPAVTPVTLVRLYVSSGRLRRGTGVRPIIKTLLIIFFSILSVTNVTPTLSPTATTGSRLRSKCNQV